MNTRQEIFDAFDKQTRDLPPPAVFTQTGTVGQMDSCGCGWPEANWDVDKMVTLALETSRRFGFATARVPFSITVEAEALGCTIEEGTRDRQPAVVGIPCPAEGDSTVPDVPDLVPVDEFLAHHTPQTVIDSARRLSQREDLFTVTGMVGPLGLVNAMIGIDNSVMGLMMEPERIEDWVKAMVPYSSAYAGVLSEAADAVLIIEEATTDLFPPEYFDMDIGTKLPGVIRSARESLVTMHACGRTIEVAPKIAAMGFDGISLETSADMKSYMDAVGGRTLMMGSVNPLSTLLAGTPADVLSSARACVDAGFGIITPECGIPPRTPDANLEMLAKYREN